MASNWSIESPDATKKTSHQIRQVFRRLYIRVSLTDGESNKISKVQWLSVLGETYHRKTKQIQGIIPYIRSSVGNTYASHAYVSEVGFNRNIEIRVFKLNNLYWNTFDQTQSMVQFECIQQVLLLMNFIHRHRLLILYGGYFVLLQFMF